MIWWLVGCLVASEGGVAGVGEVQGEVPVLRKGSPEWEQDGLAERGGVLWRVIQIGKPCQGQVLVEQRAQDGRQLVFFITDKQSFPLYLVESAGSELRMACDVNRTGEARAGIVSTPLSTFKARTLGIILPDPSSKPAVDLHTTDENRAPTPPPLPTNTLPQPLETPTPGDAPTPSTAPTPGDAPTPIATPTPLTPLKPGGLSAPQ